MKKRIFITGSCSSNLGNWEQQLGNAAILIGLLKTIHKYIPESNVLTKYRLSSEFSETYKINSIPIEPEKGFKFKRIIMTFLNFFSSLIWRVLFQIFKKDIKLFRSSKLLDVYYNSDIVIDLSGDTYGDNIPLRNFIKHSFDILSARLMGKPTVALANSPGPFSGKIKKYIALKVLNNFTVITVREPISAKLLHDMKVKTPIFITACPAFLLEPASDNRVREIMNLEGIEKNIKPLVGITLGGYNLYSSPSWDTPKTFKDLDFYIPAIEFLVNELNAQLILIPHVYRTNPWTGQRIQGPDYVILRELRKKILEKNRSKSQNILLIEGTYSPEEVKGLIGNLDFYITGRLHAGVAALSQSIPTVLLAYGHKHFGFAKMLGCDRYVWHPLMGKDKLELLVREAWNDRENIRKALSTKISSIKELAEMNVKIIEDILKLDSSLNSSIPKEFLKKWEELTWKER